MAFLLVPAAVPAAAPEGTTSFTLPNGLVGVVIEDHRAPVATHMVWYRVGGADDPAGHSGLAHFLEHLMFKATANLEDGEFSREVAANGGEENAFTTADFTARNLPLLSRGIDSWKRSSTRIASPRRERISFIRERSLASLQLGLRTRRTSTASRVAWTI